MDLILWRHAEAAPGEPDLGRQLTAKGHKQAAKTAQWLDRHLADSCRVLVSPAQRARQTADALGRRYKVLDALAPGASPSAVLAAVGWPDAREQVLVVGHQPTLGEVAACLVSGAPRGLNPFVWPVWMRSARIAMRRTSSLGSASEAMSPR